MLQYNVAQLLKSPVGATRTYQLDDEINLEGSPIRVSGEVTFTRIDRGLLVTGGLNTRMNLSCVRCLKEFSCPTSIRLEERFLPTVNVVHGFEVDNSEELDAFFIDEHHILDLSEIIREGAIMATPMKPLCSGECRGFEY
ncbi:YceD family protein [Dehalococcoides mccartyi]|uniref:DUF177 domain-containing protein n=1 Tax=Dehalococcoides mccartyi (strain VS) TaxID=311424 RepID=D2BIM4_DEHMV|nr:DUF177 domain-containing protein [Dehalococcoides mccartyi]ACZ62174.1 hypothetical protein DhcVS_1057 [Dehalococcoides mccartyi VS]